MVTELAQLYNASVAELVDAPDLGSGSFGSESSSLSTRTRYSIKLYFKVCFSTLSFFTVGKVALETDCLILASEYFKSDRVAQSGRVPFVESGGQWFKSTHGNIFFN